MYRICLLVIALFFFGMASAHAQDCSIYLYGDLSDGPIATSEILRTIISAEEVVEVLEDHGWGGASSQWYDEQCYYSRVETYLTPTTWNETYHEACIGGTYYVHGYFCGSSYCGYDEYSLEGTWDVVCTDADQDGIADDNDNCRLTANYDQADIDSDGVGDACDVVIDNVTTNQGPDGTYIPFEGIPIFSLPSEKLQWVPSDADAAPETGTPWSWTLGIAHSYISFWTYEMSDYSPEVELTLNDDVIGYFGRWKWFSPAAYLPNDGLFWIKLIAEGADGNRSEVVHTVRVATTDTDEDGVPDVLDNCPDIENSKQGDLDGDGVGNECDVELYSFWPTITNLGLGGEYIAMHTGLAYAETASQHIVWSARDPNAPDDGLGWGSRQGITASFVSFRQAESDGYGEWSGEVEALKLSGPVGWYGPWSWVYPADLIMAPGLYQIKLISENAEGLRYEEVYIIEVDAP